MLTGLRVLDFTRVLAGPYATRVLADYGAQVIKVQSKRTAQGAEAELSPYFCAWNRNKKGITLDMAHPEARQLARRLVAVCDVVIENFSPRVMGNWGLDYRRLVEVKPDCILVSMSGMGQSGPWKNHVAFGPTVHALSGLTYLTSFERDAPLGPGFAYADLVAGLYAVLAVLGALEHREKTGKGQHIDLSQYEAMCSLMGPVLMEALAGGKDPLPLGNGPQGGQDAPQGCYPCLGEDRWCVIAVHNDSQWNALCGVLGNPHWAKDERFRGSCGRSRWARELDGHIGRWTGGRKAETVAAALQGAGVPAAVVQNAEDLSKDPRLLARGAFVALEHPVLGTMASDAPPIGFGGPWTVRRSAAPLLGQDNRYVYMELLGLTETQLSDYEKRGVIG